MFEFKCYNEIDLDESPIVVLSCGHFFTAETLDGHMGMSEVYETDIKGDFTSLRNDEGSLAGAPPRCPDCKKPVRQFATQRYNRAVNRAVLDESSKRFLVSGTEKIRHFDKEIENAGEELAEVRYQLIANGGERNLRKDSPILCAVKDAETKARDLYNKIRRFKNDVADICQPARKLHDATVNALQRTSALNKAMANLAISNNSLAAPQDRRVTLGAQGECVKALFILLEHSSSLKKDLYLGNLYRPDWLKVEEIAKKLFGDCEKLIADCAVANLPKLRVETSLYYGRAALLYRECTQSSESKCEEYIGTVRGFMADAVGLSRGAKFQNAETLLTAAEKVQRALRSEWYEPVSQAELESVKAAMVSGTAGIATHSGHWYNCENGHPVSHSILPFGFAARACSVSMVLLICVHAVCYR